jgi:two-component system cell cycle response regulator DivK
MRTVLVVEDNLMNLELVVQLLSDDYEVLTARDGRQGVDMASAARPDLILLDLSLPVLDGWEAARLIKADVGANTPIVALTAHAMPGDEDQALAAGCDVVLTKPLDEDLLFETIDRLLNSEPPG